MGGSIFCIQARQREPCRRRRGMVVERSPAHEQYKRLRSLAQQEASKRGALLEQSQRAYQAGDRARAHELSQQGHAHGDKMEEYNAQAAAFVFRANNSDSAEDEIDLHGLYIAEAEKFVDQRLMYAQQQHQPYVRVIVGKGLHSQDHVAKLRPAIEQLCARHGLRYEIDSKNSGVLIVYMTAGGAPIYPQPGPAGYTGGPSGAGAGTGAKKAKFMKYLKRFGPMVLKRLFRMIMKNMR